MVITIQLLPDTEHRLRARAESAGLTLEQYVTQLVEREEVQPGAAKPTHPQSFEEFTGPIARAVDATGMSEKEVEDFFTNAVKEVRANH